MDDSLKRPLDGESPQSAKVLRKDKNSRPTTLLSGGSKTTLTVPNKQSTSNHVCATNQRQNELSLKNSITLKTVKEEILANDENSNQGSTGTVDAISISSDNVSNTSDVEDKESELPYQICSICQQSFIDQTPLLLGCFHTFCSKCVLSPNNLCNQCETKDTKVTKHINDISQ